MINALVWMALVAAPAPNMEEKRVKVYMPVDKRIAVIRPYRPWLRSLAWCESTNRPWAVDATGTYFGLFQFDVKTWYSVGGRGMPHHASRREQRYRAVLLRKQRGTAPWPVCG